MLIAVDPGQHTGLAFRLDNGEWATLMADKMPDPDERLHMVLDTLVEQLGKGTTTAVIVENFKTMGYLSKYGIETIELIGAVKTLCYVYRVPIVRHDNSVRVAFEPQAKRMLRERAAKLRLTVSDHEVSALAHLLRYEYHHGKGDQDAVAQAHHGEAGHDQDGVRTPRPPQAMPIKVTVQGV